MQDDICDLARRNEILEEQGESLINLGGGGGGGGGGGQGSLDEGVGAWEVCGRGW